MVGMKNCSLCGHAVSGGDRHAKLACPPMPGARGDQRKRKERKRKRRADDSIPQRGAAVAGCGKSKGASKG
jgi:hypothetical protein